MQAPSVLSTVALVAVILALAACGRPDVAPATRAGTNAPSRLDAPYVILVSVDGLGADLLTRHETPNLDRIAAAGARAERMIPVYPTKTFPTHYSIATGMYVDRHGLVGNRFWAPDLGLSYNVADRSTVQDPRFYRGEPIWVTAERQGMVTASYFFVGSEAPVGGVRPTYWYPFDARVPLERRLDQTLAWLAMPPDARPHLIALYLEQVDVAFHYEGPDAAETAAAVAAIDDAVGRLIDGIAASPLRDRAYLIVLSDHGLMEAPPDVADSLDMGLFPGVKVAESGPYASLFIDEGGPERGPRLRDSLAAVLPPEDSVWLRADVPGRLHYSADPRVGDIVIVAAPGRRIVPSTGGPRDNPYNHGWDNLAPEMAAIFLAMGPGIAPGQVVPAFEAVHVYPFVAHLLGLQANPEIDGRLEVLLPLLRR